MKKMILIAVMMVVGIAQAKDSLCMEDLTGKNFIDREVNLYDDGPINCAGLGVKLEGEIGQDFTLEVKGSEPTSICQFKIVKRSAKETHFQLIPDVEVETGETCDYIFIKYSGERAVFSVYKTGT